MLASSFFQRIFGLLATKFDSLSQKKRRREKENQSAIGQRLGCIVMLVQTTLKKIKIKIQPNTECEE